MDGNKDDALKCLRIAKEALASGDRARATKFFSKARRLDPSLPVDDLTGKTEKEPSSSAASDHTTPNGPASTESKLRHRPTGTAAAASSSSAAASSSPSSPSYTEEQIKLVRQINKKKDYYEILGLEKNCSVEDVRKAYRKLSLKVHPDKNQAPGAEDAFKAMSKAFQCLSNEDSRKKYDVTGSEEPVYDNRRAHRQHGGGGFQNGFYDDFDADEIFRQFFYGGSSPGATQFRTFNFGGGMGRPRAGTAGDNASGFNIRTLIQLLPVVFILLLNFLPSSDPVIYSLYRSYPYEYRYTTERGVNFYVKSSNWFEQEYPIGSQKRIHLEGKVERDYVSIVTQNCRNELQRKQWGFVRETPHCEMLQQYQSGKVAAA